MNVVPNAGPLSRVKTGGQIVDAVAPAGISAPHQSSFNRLEFEIFGVRLDVHEGPGTDDAK